MAGVAIRNDIKLGGETRTIFDGYVSRLENYPEFASGTVPGDFPDFEYASPGDPGMKELAEQYRLHEIAGNGTEIERMLNLMDWVHRTLTTTNDLANPEVLTAPAIIEFVAAEGNNVNCKMKSIVLNEALLALGFHSRRLSCNPYRFDGDSHSIVTVWSETYDKWILLDPTFDTCFVNEQGELLGYLEVRDIYRNGEIPSFRHIGLVADGLRMAGVKFDSYDAWYAVYMSKNLFWAISPLKSAQGYESAEAPSWVMLEPVGYDPDLTILENFQRNENRIYHTPWTEHFFRKPTEN